MIRPRRLLAVGHSYAVALNRRFPHELARLAPGRWEVTVAAPSFVHGDLRPIRLERFPGEAAQLVPVSLYGSQFRHVMLYGRGLRRLLAGPWDLVHCWEEPFVIAGGQVAFWTGRCPLVYYTFQNIAKRYPLPFRRVERYAVERPAGWVAAGNTVETVLGERAEYAGKPHCVIPPGVDIAAFSPDSGAQARVLRELGWDAAGPPVVGFLGRFVPEKGLDTLTAALDSLRTPWRALFVGGGPLEAGLRDWGKRFADGVRVITSAVHERVPRYLNAMDLLAAPSLSTPRWREQLGRMLIEAMACGVPVVGSDSGEIPFVVGTVGLVVPEGNVSAWAGALGGLLENSRRRAELAAAGLARAHAAFSWPVIARRHLDFFEQLVARTP